MQKFKFIVLPCDGIGPEIVDASVQVLRSVTARYKVNLELDYKTVGFDSLNKFGTTLREDVLQMSKEYDGIILVDCDLLT